MHCSIFSQFLVIVLVAIFCKDVQAAPVKRGVGMVSLPLRRVQQRGDVHPLVLLQQHINRSQQRFARMTGREPPPEAELRTNLEKRVLSLPADVFASVELSKRYNTQGAKKISVSDANAFHGKPVEDDTIRLAIACQLQRLLAPTQGNQGVSSKETDALANGGISEANPPNAANSLGLDIIANDVGYFAAVQIGSPPREFRILMDSGSADLWVGSEDCKSQAGGGCGNHLFLGPASSSSFVDTNQPFQITYGTGAVAGTKVTDTVNIAGLSLDNHSFGVAKQETVEFAGDSTEFDGLMGLAQSTLSNQKVLTPPESLAKQGLVQDAITSYKISRLADDENDGVITFGWRPGRIKFDPNTLVTVDNVSKVGFWEAAMDSVSVDGTDAGFQGRKAILDTGTTLMLCPPADAAKLHSLIPGATSDGQGGFRVPCTTNAKIELEFGGRKFAIDPRDLAFAPVDLNDPTGECVSGISAGNVGDATEWLVGDTFLKSTYFSTDATKNTMSLANLV
ncbi:acid protease [Infundibulicybe gibba]|nr:acid protease [Infundibulicybe gibba]